MHSKCCVVMRMQCMFDNCINKNEKFCYSKYIYIIIFVFSTVSNYKSLHMESFDMLHNTFIIIFNNSE